MGADGVASASEKNRVAAGGGARDVETTRNFRDGDPALFGAEAQDRAMSFTAVNMSAG